MAVPVVLGIRGPDASAALRLAANAGVMHADEALLFPPLQLTLLLPTATPLVLVVVVVVLLPVQL